MRKTSGELIQSHTLRSKAIDQFNTVKKYKQAYTNTFCKYFRISRGLGNPSLTECIYQLKYVRKNYYLGSAMFRSVKNKNFLSKLTFLYMKSIKRRWRHMTAGWNKKWKVETRWWWHESYVCVVLSRKKIL